MAPQLKEYTVASEMSERARIEAFEQDLTKPVTETEIDEIRGFYDNWYNDYKYEIGQTDPEKLRATGEALLTTSYDSLKETSSTPLEFLPNDLVTEALLYAHVDTRMHLHPSRIESLKREEKKPFLPTVKKEIPAVQRFVSNGEPTHSSEFTFRPISESDAKEIGLNPVGSARKLLCDGLWVHTANLDSSQDKYSEVTSYMMLNSTPDNLSAQGQARASVLQMRNFISMDSIWNNVENQFTMYQRIAELIDTDPTLATHPDREFLTERSKQMIGLTVKASERDALARLDYFAENGMLPGAVRVYDPRSRSEQTLNTIDAIRRRYDLPIFAGNFTSVNDIRAAEDLGANAAIYILGGGGICLTPDVAKIAVDNMGDALRYANSGIKIPLVADSSTGGTYTILTGAGVSGFMKGQDIIGIEKPPYTQWFNLG
ncbi:MAG TPA: IMP dehydrogenase, partial [Candidatus Woesebacteria bacterium]|nr:IMP dehydrogenase [Candidatus Woesebacteria bacterium]